GVVQTLSARHPKWMGPLQTLSAPYRRSREPNAAASALARARRNQRVLEEAGDRHGADAARDGGDRRSALGGLGVGDVPGELAIGFAVDADVEDHRALLDPITAHEVRPPDGGDEDVGLAAE